MNIYKCIFCTFLFISSNTLIAQEISGYITSTDGENLSYVSVYLKNKNIGVVTNASGQYKLSSDILSETADTLVFSCIGYKSEKKPVSLFKENSLAGNVNISLETDYILLQEVNVKPNTEKPKEYGMFHLNSPFVLLLSGNPSSKLVVFIENTDKVSRTIKTINVKIQKSSDETKKLRVFFCQKTENGFQNINIDNEEIIISDFSKSKIKTDVSKHQIPFGEEGIYVGFEWIGVENVAQDLSKKIGLGIVCTSRLKKPNTWIFENKTETWKQVAQMAEEDKDIEEIPKFFRNPIRNILRNMNAQVGITAY